MLADHEEHMIPDPTRLYHKDGATEMSDEVNRGPMLEVTSSSEPQVTQIRFLADEG